jgi:hypothetical protein
VISEVEGFADVVRKAGGSQLVDNVPVLISFPVGIDVTS